MRHWNKILPLFATLILMGACASAPQPDSVETSGLKEARGILKNIANVKGQLCNSMVATTAFNSSIFYSKCSSSNPTSPPTAPTNLSVQTQAGDYTGWFSWVNVASDASTVQIHYRQLEPFETDWSMLVSLDSDFTSHTEVDYLEVGYKYEFQVKAVNSDGSTGSNVVTATIGVEDGISPRPPVTLLAIAQDHSSISLNWMNASATETDYAIFRSRLSNFSDLAEISTVASPQLSFMDTGLDPSTRYYYRVSARNTVGDSGFSADYTSAETEAAPTAPNPPLLLHVSNVDVHEIQITFVDGSTDETGFKVHRSLDGITFVEHADMTAPAYPVDGPGLGENLTFTDTGLDHNTRYWYKVTAYNDVGPSPEEGPIDAKTDFDCLLPVSVSVQPSQQLTESTGQKWAYSLMPGLAANFDEEEFAMIYGAPGFDRDGNPLDGEMVMSIFNPDGSLASTTFPAQPWAITDILEYPEEDGLTCQGGHKIAYDSSLDQYVMTWTTGHGACWNNHDIFANLIDASDNGGKIKGLAHPSLATTSLNNGVIDGTQLTLTPDGFSVLVSDQFNYPDGPGFGQLILNRFAAGGSDPSGLIWQDTDDPFLGAPARNSFISGRNDPPVYINPGNYTSKSSIAWNNAAQKYGISYKDSASQYSLGYVRFGLRNAEGLKDAEDLLLDSSSDLTSIAAAEEQGWGMTWVRSTQVKFQAFDINGNLKGSEIVLSSGNEVNSAKVIWTGAEYVIFWMEALTTDPADDNFGYATVHLAIRDAQGNEVMSDRTLDSLTSDHVHLGTWIHGGKFTSADLSVLSVSNTQEEVTRLAFGYSAAGNGPAADPQYTRFPCTEPSGEPDDPDPQILCSDIFLTTIEIGPHCSSSP